MISVDLFTRVLLKHNRDREKVCKELCISEIYFYKLQKKYGLKKINIKKRKNIALEIKKRNIKLTSQQKKLLDETSVYLDESISSSKITIDVLNKVEKILIGLAYDGMPWAISYILNNHGWKKGYCGVREAPKVDIDRGAAKVVEVLNYEGSKYKVSNE